MKTTRIIAVGVALLSGWATVAEEKKAEEEKGENSVAKAGVSEVVETGPVDRIALSLELAGLGRESESPTLLIAAAELLYQVPAAKKEEYKKSSEASSDVQGASQGTKEEAKGKLELPTSEELLVEAEKLAGSDAGLVKVIEKAREDGKAAQGSMGAFGGPKYATTSVDAYATDTFVIDFRGDEWATIAISGDGDTDLDLYVFDENGNLIKKSTSRGDDESVGWEPEWTGPFQVKVKNCGNVYNQYVLLTN